MVLLQLQVIPLIKREAKWQKVREKCASLPSDKKAQLNAKRWESYHRKKAEKLLQINSCKLPLVTN
jgi:hypothetical protein